MMSPVSYQSYMIWHLVLWVVVENWGVRCVDQLSGVKMNTWSYCWSWEREPTSFTRLTGGSQSAPTCRLTRSQNHRQQLEKYTNSFQGLTGRWAFCFLPPCWAWVYKLQGVFKHPFKNCFFATVL